MANTMRKQRDRLGVTASNARGNVRRNLFGTPSVAVGERQKVSIPSAEDATEQAQFYEKWGFDVLTDTFDPSSDWKWKIEPINDVDAMETGAVVSVDEVGSHRDIPTNETSHETPAGCRTSSSCDNVNECVLAASTRRRSSLPEDCIRKAVPTIPARRRCSVAVPGGTELATYKVCVIDVRRNEPDVCTVIPLTASLMKEALLFTYLDFPNKCCNALRMQDETLIVLRRSDRCLFAERRWDQWKECPVCRALSKTSLRQPCPLRQRRKLDLRRGSAPMDCQGLWCSVRC